MVQKMSLLTHFSMAYYKMMDLLQVVRQPQPKHSRFLPHVIFQLFSGKTQSILILTTARNILNSFMIQILSQTYHSFCKPVSTLTASKKKWLFFILAVLQPICKILIFLNHSSTSGRSSRCLRQTKKINRNYTLQFNLILM